MQQQQPGTVIHSRISSLLISRCLTGLRVASRYSVWMFTWPKWAWHPQFSAALCAPVAEPPLSKFLNPPLLWQYVIMDYGRLLLPCWRRTGTTTSLVPRPHFSRSPKISLSTRPTLQRENGNDPWQTRSCAILRFFLHPYLIPSLPLL